MNIKPQFWGLEYAFSSQTREIKNMHVIETTASIPNCSQRQRPPNALRRLSKHAHYKCKMAESRHIEKMGKSAYLRESLTDRQEI